MSFLEVILRLGIGVLVVLIIKMVLELALSTPDSTTLGIIIGVFTMSVDKIIALAFPQDKK